MFRVNSDTKKITMHRGDTGTVRFRLPGLENLSTDNVKVVFSMRNKHNIIVKSGIYEPDGSTVPVGFLNDDTGNLDPGLYSYDIRVVGNAVYGEDGKIIEGDLVYTPHGAPFEIELLDTVGII